MLIIAIRVARGLRPLTQKIHYIFSLYALCPRAVVSVGFRIYMHN